MSRPWCLPGPCSASFSEGDGGELSFWPNISGQNQRRIARHSSHLVNHKNPTGNGGVFCYEGRPSEPGEIPRLFPRCRGRIILRFGAGRPPTERDRFQTPSILQFSRVENDPGYEPRPAWSTSRHLRMQDVHAMWGTATDRHRLRGTCCWRGQEGGQSNAFDLRKAMQEIDDPTGAASGTAQKRWFNATSKSDLDMATAEQLRYLIQSHFTRDEERFTTVALQVAAHEARSGHPQLAQEIRAPSTSGSRMRPRSSSSGQAPPTWFALSTTCRYLI